MMRKLGFLMLYVGFAWITILQVGSLMRLGIRPILQDRYEKLSQAPTTSYSRSEVETHIRETAVSVYEARALFIFSGALMFFGGLVLAFTPRQRKRSGTVINASAA